MAEVQEGLKYTQNITFTWSFDLKKPFYFGDPVFGSPLFYQAKTILIIILFQALKSIIWQQLQIKLLTKIFKLIKQILKI